VLEELGLGAAIAGLEASGVIGDRVAQG
jgi:hypothetical protein